jgi:hypothetical protein
MEKRVAEYPDYHLGLMFAHAMILRLQALVLPIKALIGAADWSHQSRCRYVHARAHARVGDARNGMLIRWPAAIGKPWRLELSTAHCHKPTFDARRCF